MFLPPREQKPERAESQQRHQPAPYPDTVREKPPIPIPSPDNFLHLQFQNPATLFIREGPAWPTAQNGIIGISARKAGLTGRCAALGMQVAT